MQSSLLSGESTNDKCLAGIEFLRNLPTGTPAFPVTSDAPVGNKANMRIERQMVHLGSFFVPLTVATTDVRTHRLSMLIRTSTAWCRSPFKLTERLSGPGRFLNVCSRALMVRRVFVLTTGASSSRCSFSRKHERFWRPLAGRSRSPTIASLSYRASPRVVCKTATTGRRSTTVKVSGIF